MADRQRRATMRFAADFRCGRFATIILVLAIVLFLVLDRLD